MFRAVHPSQYFKSVVLNVFAETLDSLGFQLMRTAPVGYVAFAKGQMFFMVGYELQDGPGSFTFWTWTGLHDHSVADRVHHETGCKFAGSAFLSETWSPMPDKGRWWFSSPENLRERLEKIRDEVVLPVLANYWGDEKRFRRKLDELNRKQLLEIDERNLQASEERLLKTALERFKASDFAAAIEAYERVREERRSQVDRKRLEIAKHKLNG